MADGQTARVESGRVSTGFGQALDAATLERARRGDMTAHAAIYERYAGACYTLALRVLGEPAAAEDVVQEVFLRMFGTIGSFRGDAPFGAWLKRMAANATIDVVRARQRFASEDANGHMDALQDATMVAEDRVDAWSMLMRLTPRARAIVILHEAEGYTHRELGELFGQSESYSKSILARALKWLDGTARAVPENPT
jgi:RNA polymerase sigma factor (sigma-70 family)